MANKKVLISLVTIALVSMLLTGCGGSSPSAGVSYTLEITVDGQGTVEPESGNAYTDGTLVTLVPVAAENWVFAEWAGANGTEVVNNRILMNGDKSITGVFHQNDELYQGSTQLLTSFLEAIETQNGANLEALFATSFEFVDPDGVISTDPTGFISAVIVSAEYDSEVPSDAVVLPPTVTLSDRTISENGVVSGTFDLTIEARSAELGVYLTRSISGQLLLTVEQDASEAWKITSIDASGCEWDEVLAPDDGVNLVIDSLIALIESQTGNNAQTVADGIAALFASDFSYTDPEQDAPYSTPAESVQEFCSFFVLDKDDEDTPDDILVHSVSLTYGSREYTEENLGEISGNFAYDLEVSSESEGVLFTESVSGIALVTVTNTTGEWLIRGIDLGLCTTSENVAPLP